MTLRDEDEMRIRVAHDTGHTDCDVCDLLSGIDALRAKIRIRQVDAPTDGPHPVNEIVLDSPQLCRLVSEAGVTASSKVGNGPQFESGMHEAAEIPK